MRKQILFLILLLVGGRLLADSQPFYLNFSDRSCPYCLLEDRGEEVEERLLAAGFEKRAGVSARKHHCFGGALCMLESLLKREGKKSARETILELALDPLFRKRAHAFSVNQPLYYSWKGSPEPLEWDRALLRCYFEALLGREVYDLYATPRGEMLPLSEEVFREGFQRWRNSFLLIGYVKGDNIPHAIVLSTDEKKPFVFDPNEGMFEFLNGEEWVQRMSAVLKGGKLMFAVVWKRNTLQHTPFPGVERALSLFS